MHIRVTNKHYDNTPGEYIGRPSVLGNPFVLGRDGDRSAVVDMYRRWLWQRIKEGGAILEELQRLKTHAQRKELVLVCWCKQPGKEVACHGDVIKQALEWLERKEHEASGLALAPSEARPLPAISEPAPEPFQLSIFQPPAPLGQESFSGKCAETIVED